MGRATEPEGRADARPRRPVDRPWLRRALGLIRVGHPGPSLLNGLAAGAIAVVAGAETGTAVRLGAAMTLLQLAIGATNDLVDAERDAAAQRAKPIPVGLVESELATILAAVAAIGGLGLAASVGVAVVGVAVVGLALGLAYDLWLRSTGLGWLAFVLALPLVPLYGWLGGSGSLPGPILVLAAAAAPAGLGLAIANGRRDVDADRRSGTPSLALRLGRRGRVAMVLAHGLALGLVAAALLAWGGGGTGLGLAGLGTALLAVGLALPPSARAWEVQAVGLAVVGVGWLAALRERGVL